MKRLLFLTLILSAAQEKEPNKDDGKLPLQRPLKKSMNDMDALKTVFNFPAGPTTTNPQPKK